MKRLLLRDLGVFLFILGNVLFWPSEELFAWNSLVTGGRCQQTHRYCRSTVGNAGGAGACCDPLSSKIFYCISNNSCRGGHPYAWDFSDLPLKWTIGASSVPADFAHHTMEDYEKAFIKAWDGWTKPACTSFSHRYIGRDRKSEAKVILYLPSKALWSAMGVPSSVLAFAQPSPRSNGRLYRGTIYFNPNINWGLPTASVSSNQYDLTEVAHHEMGHILGFAHTPYRTAVMYFQAQSSGPNYNGPQPDDIEAVCHIYPRRDPKSCQKDADCAGCGRCQKGVCTRSNGRIGCPCRADNECRHPLVCKNALCQKAGGGETFDKCSAKIPCKKGFYCVHTIQGHVCLKMCKDSANFPPGLPGSSCRIDGSCPAGNECHILSNGRTLCLRTCKSAADCTGGGECLDVDLYGQRQKFCLCSKTKGCRNGKFCNTSYLGSEIGVCTKKVAASRTCPQGFTCQALGNGHTACLPNDGDRKVGDTCNAMLRCRKGLVCSLVSATSNKLVCVEDCSGTNLCSLRGRCRPVDRGIRQCFCYGGKSCGSGRSCEMNVHGRGVCTAPANVCGNAVCEPKNGENCASCAQDCGCESDKFCNPRTKRCEKAHVCGNGRCEPQNKENCANCPKDCACGKDEVCQGGICQKAHTCGDGICQRDEGETCSSCAKDCACGEGEKCQFGMCIKNCGDGKCEADKKENCETCPQDCGCQSPNVCRAGKCQIPKAEKPDAGIGREDDLNCPNGQIEEKCDESGKNCRKVCITTSGCACQSSSEAFIFSPVALLMSFLFLLFTWRRRFYR